MVGPSLPWRQTLPLVFVKVLDSPLKRRGTDLLPRQHEVGTMLPSSVISVERKGSKPMADRVDEVKGRLKEAAGNITGSRRTEEEGKAAATAARAKRKVKGAAKEIRGVVKETLGDLMGDRATAAEGTADRLQGKVERSR